MRYYSMDNKGWSKPINGLQIWLVAPKGPHKAGNFITLTLRFRNVGTENSCIYMIDSEVFRWGQSTIFVFAKHDHDGDFIAMQPEPHPHGYIVDEKDLHLIKPGQQITFEQTLYLSVSEFEQGGEFIVEWKYENDVRSWPGGIMTLNGPNNGAPFPRPAYDSGWEWM